MSNAAHLPPSPDDDLEEECRVLERAYARERERRRCAENMLEQRSRDLYEKIQELSAVNDDLVRANLLVRDQSEEFDGLSSQFQRVTEELQLAASTQMGLLPAPLDSGEIAASGFYKPAEFIAGDGYDYFQLDDNLFAFYVLDVAGHGVAAAMVSFAAHVHLNPKQGGLCQNSIDDTESLSEAVVSTLMQLNHIFYVDAGSSHYFTMIYGLLDTITGEVSFGQAGHPAPLLYRAEDQSITEKGDGGNPVAMFEDPLFGVTSFVMRAGDRLLVYSDGATECCNSDCEEFGVERIGAIVKQTSGMPLDQACDCIYAELEIWNTSKEFDDDLSMLFVDFRGVAEPKADLPTASKDEEVKAHYDIPCSMEGISQYELELEVQLKEFVANDEQLFLISLSVVEVLSNIVEHGFQGNADVDELMQVDLQVVKDDIKITITDGAAPLPLKTVEHLTLKRVAMPNIDTENQALPESGWGLNIVTDTAKEIEYLRLQNSNVLSLYFAHGKI